jgi:hypothetical protein
MAISDFSSLFSRQFLIGFFAPALSGLFLVSQFLPVAWRPSGYQNAAPSTQVIIVAAAGIFLALLLSGLQYPFIRLLEGYPLQRLASTPLLGSLYRSRIGAGSVSSMR